MFVRGAYDQIHSPEQPQACRRTAVDAAIPHSLKDPRIMAAIKDLEVDVDEDAESEGGLALLFTAACKDTVNCAAHDN